MNEVILLTVGVPTHKSEVIAQLSQLDTSIFGKIIFIKNKDILNNNSEKIQYSIDNWGCPLI